MKRPTQDEYFMNIARVVATRSNCYRRQVGCVIIDANHNILSTGYNGVPSGYPHCKPGECPREKITSGTSLDICLATHAEANALLQCHDVDKIWKIYLTDSPCLPCTVMLLNTSCYFIVFGRQYPGLFSQIAWERLNRKWVPYEKD